MSLPPRIFLLAMTCLLTGCAIHGISLPRGIYLPNCSYGALPESQPARCMTRAEYKTAKEKARHSREEDSGQDAKQVDPRYKNWIP